MAHADCISNRDQERIWLVTRKEMKCKSVTQVTCLLFFFLMYSIFTAVHARGLSSPAWFQYQHRKMIALADLDDMNALQWSGGRIESLI